MAKSHVPPGNGYISVSDALFRVEVEQWTDLSNYAESLLKEQRRDPAMAQYLAGVHGSELVSSAIILVHLSCDSAASNGKQALFSGSQPAFLHYLQSIILNVVRSFGRKKEAQIFHEPLALIDAGKAVEPSLQVKNFSSEISLRDLFRVLLPRLANDLKRNPRQLAIWLEYAEAICNGDFPLARKRGNFVHHSVRALLRKHLQELAATELGIQKTTGREMLLPS